MCLEGRFSVDNHIPVLEDDKAGRGGSGGELSNEVILVQAPVARLPVDVSRQPDDARPGPAGSESPLHDNVIFLAFHLVLAHKLD